MTLGISSSRVHSGNEEFTRTEKHETGNCSTLKCFRCGRVCVAYRVIQEESAVLWEIIVCVILSRKVHTNLCPILNGYGITTA